MKNLKFFVFLTMLAGLMWSCEKESVELAQQETIAEYQERFKADMEAYFAEHETVKIEHRSLEELNADLVRYGMEPVTLEELGVTKEEYEAAQARINDPNRAASRCSGNLTVYYLDMNDSGSLSVSDISLAQQVILNLRPPSYDSWLFGYASAIWPRPEDGATSPPSNPNTYLSTFDLLIAQKILLGIYVCQ